MAEISRRDLFQIAGVAALAPAPAAAQAHKPAAPYPRKIFDERQWALVRLLCDLIIPADERSGGASQAGVPEFIDDWLDFRKQEEGNDNLAAEILGGLAWLDRESMRLNQKYFINATHEQQTTILDRIAWPGRAAAEDLHAVAFFTKFRDLTASGFFSSKMGVADLPYLGNQAVEEWKGCDPAAWARIEERMKNGYKGLGGQVKPWSDQA